MTAVLGVIPARYGATRFPGKPLALLWGKPLIQHVWERARAVPGVGELVVATDDERIARVAGAFGATVEMTSRDHGSGTDRVAEVARRRPGAALVINLQGDEPELDAEAVAALVAGMGADPALAMATLAHVETEPGALAAPDVVKVAVDADDYALYFSREPARSGSNGRSVLRHVGVYGFRREFLLEFASWPPTARERAERLEQLRAIERGVRIKVYVGRHRFAGVDTPEELAALEQRGPRGQ
jgi:3-deoxy-manno-octulosonate cytidylyltransferase (CMP-KDO synthetase)